MSATTRTLLSSAALALALTAPTPAQDLPGQALGFDGVDDVVLVPGGPALDIVEAFTVEAWVRPHGPDGGIAAMWGPGGAIDKFLLHLDDGYWTARIARAMTPGTVVVTGPEAPLDAWTHVAMSYDGEDVWLFINGEPSESEEADGELVPHLLDFQLGIEEMGLGFPHFLDGELDEVRLWGVARTPDEIARFYNQVVDPDHPDLLGSWRLDDGAGQQVVADASGMANHGMRGVDLAAGVDDPMPLQSTAPVRWADLGQGLAGTHGVPSFAGEGTLVAATPVTLVLDGMLENSEAHLVIGYDLLELPFRGGTMVPELDLLVSGLFTGPSGSAVWVAPWPVVPPGVDFYLQVWIEDTGAPEGLAGTNALWLETP